LAGIPTGDIVRLTPHTVGSVTTYDVELESAPENTTTSDDIAKQLVTTVGTLVTAVAAF